MSALSEDIQHLAEEFESCQKILRALGDENRQHLILEMMRIDDTTKEHRPYHTDALYPVFKICSQQSASSRAPASIRLLPVMRLPLAFQYPHIRKDRPERRILR